jgi:hypothetical protein
MKKLVWMAAAVGVVTPAVAQEIPDHGTFGRVLEQHLQGFFVDYAAIRADPRDLEDYLTQQAATPASVVEGAPRNTQLAFWINAYNACALKLVVDHYPIEKRGGLGAVVNVVRGIPANSIQQIPDTWKREFCDVAGKTRSLDEIEHEIIRPMGEPRIHFAVNCASRSCPVLAPKPYTGEGLDEELDAAVARFVADVSQYRLERGEGAVLHVNKILEWYGDDFGGEEGVLAFLMKYIPEADAEYIRQHGPARLAFEDYDWTLNDTAVWSGR